ncbi:MAG: hypothetical protein MUF70_09565 [Myxococcota bacterium]|jgi:hypothetical protein|nr:hypothetical protein [Myxococcota bacterium]
MRSFAWALVALAFALPPRMALAQTLPKLDGGLVRAKVEATSSGYFKYQYKLSVESGEELAVTEFTVDVDQGSGRAIVQRDDLPPSASGVLPSTRQEREESADKAVGLSISGVPPKWSAGVDRERAVRWGANVDESKLTAGHDIAGYEISSRALPGVREARLEPDLHEHLPNVDENPEAEAVYDEVPASAQVSSTIGPMAPPEPFSPRAFADDIGSMIDVARARGWIGTNESKEALSLALDELRTALDASEFNDARSAAASFITFVNLNGCGVYTCGGSLSISSEGYALLRYNMEYLRDRIPTTIRTTFLDDDEVMDSIIEDEIIRAEGRIGDQGGTSSAELTLVQDLAGPEQSAQFAYPSNVIVPFVFAFDGRTARLDVGGGGRILRTTSLTYPLYVVPENLFVRAGAEAATSSVAVTDLVLDGQPMLESVVATAGEGGLKILRVEASGLDDGFTLAGNVTMIWTGDPPSGSELSVQLRAADVHSGPD